MPISAMSPSSRSSAAGSRTLSRGPAVFLWGYSLCVAVRIVESSGSRETEELGAELAEGLEAGDVVLICGELGSGKTTLVRGAARALGVSGPVTSPTFSIGHRYPARGVTVSHLDLYRLAGLGGEDPALLADHVGPGRIAFVEWPEAAGGELAGARLRVTLTHRGEDRRCIEVVDLGGVGNGGVAQEAAAR